MSQVRHSVPHPWWQPWLAVGLFSFLLHFTWEMLQLPFYSTMVTADHWAAVLRCTRATGGDVLIATFAYAIVAWWAGDRLWLAAPRGRWLVLFLTLGLAITAALEWRNVYVRGTWAYAADMPVALGVGLTPILQWVIVPLSALWLARRHLGWGPYGAVHTAEGREGPRL